MRHQHVCVMEGFFHHQQRAFFKALLPRCGMRASPAGGKEGAYPSAYPALSHSASRNTRGGAARAGLNNFAPSQKRTGLVNRRFGRLDVLK